MNEMMAFLRQLMQIINDGRLSDNEKRNKVFDFIKETYSLYERIERDTNERRDALYGR